MLPNGLTSLGTSAFHACSQLEGIIVPAGVAIIESGTFSDSNLASIIIPPSVTSIGKNVFWQCFNITILGEPGSYAQDYVKDNDIPFIISVQSDSSVQSG